MKSPHRAVDAFRFDVVLRRVVAAVVGGGATPIELACTCCALGRFPMACLAGLRPNSLVPDRQVEPSPQNGTAAKTSACRPWFCRQSANADSRFGPTPDGAIPAVVQIETG